MVKMVRFILCIIYHNEKIFKIFLKVPDELLRVFCASGHLGYNGEPGTWLWEQGAPIPFPGK